MTVHDQLGTLAERPDPSASVTSHSSVTHATVQPSTLDECAEIALASDILGLFASMLTKCGVVGEERLAKILYLAVTSRLFARPVSVAVKGPSSGGKSYTVGKVLSFFPKSAYHELSGMSEKALLYADEPLKNRMLVIYEAAGFGDFAEYLLRTLLSEGHLRYVTVEKSLGGSQEARTIEKEGPTGLIVTTTLPSMNPENETRYLSVAVADTREQTRQILLSMAGDRPHHSHVDLEPWHRFQRGLEQQPRDVVVPFAVLLAEQIAPLAVRLRRDFEKLLTLIRAHALLHHTTRQRDELGRIIAVVNDYRVAYELVADLISTSVDATVPPTVRETVESVARLLSLQKASSGSVTNQEVADVLGLDKSATSRRVREAIQRGYLANLESHHGRPARIVLGDAMPQERKILPTPNEVEDA